MGLLVKTRLTGKLHLKVEAHTTESGSKLTLAEACLKLYYCLRIEESNTILS